MAQIFSWCRHCGSPNALTEEHLPPKSVGNDGEISASPLTGTTDDFEAHEVLDAIRQWRTGHTVPTLCEDCNNKASNWKYVNEYGRWHDAFVSEAHGRVTESGGRADPFDFGQTWTVDLPYDFNPRRFVGQCIGMFLATQRSERLWVNHPIFREAIGAELPNDPKNPPGPVDLNEVRLFVSLANQDIVYSRDAAWAVNMSLGGVSNSGLILAEARWTLGKFKSWSSRRSL